MNKVTCIDLFCGAGGLTHGLQRQGLNVMAGVDIEETCRHPFQFNNSSIFIKEDISRVSGDQLKELYERNKITVLALACPH
jgi:DNA (cytosine-5)-methyltransferase 1